MSQATKYEQPAAGDAFFSVFGPQVGGHLEPRALVTLDYGHRPFSLSDEAGNEIATPSKGQLHLHAGASLALWDRLMVSVGIPVALFQEGDTLELDDGTALQATSGGDVGELHVGLRGRIVGEYWDAFQLGAAARIYLPTATGPWSSPMRPAPPSWSSRAARC